MGIDVGGSGFGIGVFDGVGRTHGPLHRHRHDQPVLPRFLVPFVRRLKGCNGTGQLALVSRVLLR